MKNKKLRRLSGVLCALMLIVSMSCLVSAGDSYLEGDAVVIRFDSVPAVARIISSVYGMNAGFLDGCLQCRFFIEPGIFTMSFDENQVFSADEYKYMKIKYFANTMLKETNIYYSTDLSPEIEGSKCISFKRGVNKKWKESIIDLSSYGKWTGNVTAMRVDVITKYAPDIDQYAFIEYIAFFRTEEEAEAFGGLTEAQENGTDLISRYAEGYRTSRVDLITYTVPGEPRADIVLTPSSGETTANDAQSAAPASGGGGISTANALIILAAAVVGGAIIIVAAVSASGKKKPGDGTDK